MKKFRWLNLTALCLVLVFALGTMVSAAVGGELEIFSWWAGDEGPALEALIALYESKYPNVTVINATVTGGSGVNAKAVLKTRMLGGDPPDSFQVHAGQELIGTWVVADRMEDLTWLFEEEDWFDAFPEDLFGLLSTEEGIWSVPVNIHRSNVLYFIPDNLEKWGVEAPGTWEEFLEIAPKLVDQGVIPLSVGENWTATHLWESVALSVLGADKYSDLWAGRLAWTSPEVIQVWELFGEILEYTNPDAPSLSWQQATDMVVEGQAALNIMGDWASGYLSVTLGVKPGDGYGWAASPGTTGVFMALSDSFGIPVGCPNRENTIAWLKTIGSLEGQDTFNPLKGSISARIDSDLSKYDLYLQSAAQDYQTDRIVGSLAHGVVANERFMNDFATVMDIFLANRDARAASNAAHVVAVQSGMAQ